MIADADVLKDKKIKHLVGVYTAMKAKQAAQVIESLDTDLAVKILSGMRGRSAGAILGYVSPKKAAKLSEELTKLQTPSKMTDKMPSATEEPFAKNQTHHSLRWHQFLRLAVAAQIAHCAGRSGKGYSPCHQNSGAGAWFRPY